jgi:hypothetical protein
MLIRVNLIQPGADAAKLEVRLAFGVVVGVAMPRFGVYNS